MRFQKIPLEEIFEGESVWQQEPEFWEQESPLPVTNRNTPEYIRWVQSALNRILGLNLLVDGVVGPQTRSAIRSFQLKNGLAVDGIVGSNTEAAMKEVLPGAQIPPQIQPSITTPALITPSVGQIIQRTVYGWSQYKRKIEELPPDQQSVLRSAGDAIISSYKPGGRPVRTVKVHGHSDWDTPRNLSREQQYSEERAQIVTNWLRNYVGSTIATRIVWETRGFGATKLKARPTTEANRKQNRRVEIVFRTVPCIANSLFAVQNSSHADVIIRDFCVRMNGNFPDWRLPNGKTKSCYQAVNEVILYLKRSYSAASPKSCPTLSYSGFQLCKSITRHERFKFVSGYHYCLTPNYGDGLYDVINYNKDILAKAIGDIKSALDAGCCVRIGVVSGLYADDKWGRAGGRCLERTYAFRWRDCPEHWLLIIGYIGNQFVFWDYSKASSEDGCSVGLACSNIREREFGFLFYADGRLSTASDERDLKVGCRSDTVDPAGGYHIYPKKPQKRYQVVNINLAAPQRPAVLSSELA